MLGAKASVLTWTGSCMPHTFPSSAQSCLNLANCAILPAQRGQGQDADMLRKSVLATPGPEAGPQWLTAPGSSACSPFGEARLRLGPPA